MKISLPAASGCVARALCVMFVTGLNLNVCAQDAVAIKAVNVTIQDGQTSRQTGGYLRKIGLADRKKVAKIAADGRLNPSVSCSSGDEFEADADDELMYAVYPQRQSCNSTLIFRFNRSVLVALQAGQENLKLSNGAGPKVFSNYALVFARAGEEEAAELFRTEAITSTAKLLGDAELSTLVSRDPQQSYRLVFSEAGVKQLRIKQSELGLTVTGQLDAKTQEALVLRDVTVAGRPLDMRTLEVSECARGSSERQFICSPASTKPPKDITVRLPELRVPLKY